MSDPLRIEPALSAEEWKDVPRRLETNYDDGLYQLCSPGITAKNLPEIIARANALLPDSDPRKITWEWIEMIRQCADFIEGAYGGQGEREDNARYAARVRRIADALASYLPSREAEDG